MDTKICQLLLLRDEFTETTTLGKMYINGTFCSYTLEDTHRGQNVKVQDKTSIPEGTYQVKVTKSNRFNRDMPILLNVPMFTGIRIHGGNSHRDSSGCILVAENRSGEKIWGSEEKSITRELKRYSKIYITIVNKQKA